MGRWDGTLGCGTKVYIEYLFPDFRVTKVVYRPRSKNHSEFSLDNRSLTKSCVRRFHIYMGHLRRFHIYMGHLLDTNLFFFFRSRLPSQVPSHFG